MAHSSANPGRRAMEALLMEAASARGIRVEAIGGGAEAGAGAGAGAGWILRFTLEREGVEPVVRHAHGYCMDLNTAGTHLLAMDKAGTSDALAAAGLAAIEHRVFLHPRLGPFVPREGNWPSMLAYAEGYGLDVVVKDNAGTGGYGIRRVRHARDLERAVYEAFQRTHAVSLSPYHQIDREVRFVVLEGRIELAYAKERLQVVGDGVRSVLELLAAMMRSGGANARREPMSRLLNESDESALRVLGSVPAAGEVSLLNWKHNLGQGASAHVLSEPERDAPELAALAVAAARAINLRFGSVDVVVARPAGQPEGPATPRVMEINAGVMMESLANDSAQGLAHARRIYDRALAAMFDLAR